VEVVALKPVRCLCGISSTLEKYYAPCSISTVIVLQKYPISVMRMPDRGSERVRAMTSVRRPKS